jgi:hypothetical protein
MERVTNSETGKFRFFLMSEGEYRALTDDYEGLCVACGATRGACEPDARKYDCTEGCGRFMVYGAGELMLMGRIRFDATDAAGVQP